MCTSVSAHNSRYLRRPDEGIKSNGTGAAFFNSCEPSVVKKGVLTTIIIDTFKKSSHQNTYHGFFCFKTCPHYIAQSGFELMIFLPQLPMCWGYSYCGILLTWFLLELCMGSYTRNIYLVCYLNHCVLLSITTNRSIARGSQSLNSNASCLSSGARPVSSHCSSHRPGSCTHRRFWTSHNSSC